VGQAGPPPRVLAGSRSRLDEPSTFAESHLLQVRGRAVDRCDPLRIELDLGALYGRQIAEAGLAGHAMDNENVRNLESGHGCDEPRRLVVSIEVDALDLGALNRSDGHEGTARLQRNHIAGLKDHLLPHALSPREALATGPADIDRKRSTPGLS
jgi:hypothetical protein